MALHAVDEDRLTAPLFHSDRGLYDFHASFTAYGYVRRDNLVAADTGLGKTIIALATMALLFEDDLIDTVLCLVENNKLTEWADDFAKFCPNIPVTLYRGARETRLNKIKRGLKRVVLATHETARADLVARDEADDRKMSPGPLLTAMDNHRTMIVLDECTVYGGGESKLHMGLLYAIGQLDNPRKMGLTGTPLTSSPLSYYHLGCILCPDRMQSLEQFYKDHVRAVNRFGQPYRFENLDVLAERMSTVLLRKRKTDPDVRSQFPTTIEKMVMVDLEPKHLDAYERLDALADEIGGQFTFNTMMSFVNHPHSLLESESKVAEEYIARYGVESVLKLRSTKSGYVIPDVQQMVRGGDQVLIFADHTKVLRALSVDLDKAKINHGTYSGDFTKQARERTKAGFKAGDFPVMLLSSAGERGMNLPEAGCVINYDIPQLHSSYIQRGNRSSRIGANVGGSLVVKSYMSVGTVEEAAVGIWTRRNAWSDTLVDFDAADDEHFMSATDRTALIKAARERLKKE